MKINKYLSFCLTGLFCGPLLLGCYPKASPTELAPQADRIVTAQNQLGFELLHELYQPQKNIFLSPTSLYLALAMLYNGAEGDTQKEMAKLLHLKGMTDQELNEAASAWLTHLSAKQPGFLLEIANALWVREGFALKPQFQELLKSAYAAEAHEASFDNTTLQKINDWAKRKTHGKIPLILEQIEADLVVLILNAIYFKGAWKKEFNPDSTFPTDFLISKREKLKVSMMRQEGKFAYLENEHWQMVKLPYANENMEMVLFLPKAELPLHEVHAELNSSAWEQWQSQFQPREGSVMLPRFKFEFAKELSPELKKLGMRSAFAQANFQRMSAKDLTVSYVLHKSFVEVNEQGTEAAAVTASGIKTTSVDLSRFVFQANRPFAFGIVQKKQGAFLFLGSLQSPEAL